jgi:tRNA (cmo5U34)-methyltransferase
VGQFHQRPDAYLALMRAEVPDYDRFQDAAAAATGAGAARILELGTGTGETARRVLDLHPQAHLVGLDASAAMLELARAALPADRVTLVLGDLAAPLPDGRFDLVVSALCVHHLDGPGKEDLFRRIAAVLAPGGRLVLADVVVPLDPADAVTPLDPAHDRPSSALDQLRWLAAAGLRPRLEWARRDLAVLTADLAAPPAGASRRARPPSPR